MSLTSYLKNTKSPIRRFLRDAFPNTRPFLAGARKHIRQTRTIRPATNVRWDIVSTALDYRIRYYFAVTKPEELVAYKGAHILTAYQSLSSSIQLDYRWNGNVNDVIMISDRHTGNVVYNYLPLSNGGWSGGDVEKDVVSKAMELGDRIARGEHSSSRGIKNPLKDEYGNFFKSLSELTTAQSPVGTRLPQPDEDALNRHCVVLALMEEVARTGKTSDTILAADRFDNNPLISIAESHWIDDLRELSFRFFDNFSQLISLPFVLNPSFDGSEDIGGADADLIVDGTLIDIKTTIKQEIKPDWIWQILGYTLLDYSDRYRINGVGLYMSRKGILFRWDIDEALQGLCLGKPQTIDELRRRFRELLESTSYLKASHRVPPLASLKRSNS